ncbi:hypothetical protein KIPB_005372 [Kipferlia bialata]|uniref:Uncharacterized protein n=1 Tax=Kipferlia bialata TaxID=797122 RepID=A0A9K3GJ02_9EUKA|nr:hypothetical protein KIPB_005372 [Kipferlia bialata]|eukprot:g5372.t1
MLQMSWSVTSMWRDAEAWQISDLVPIGGGRAILRGRERCKRENKYLLLSVDSEGAVTREEIPAPPIEYKSGTGYSNFQWNLSSPYDTELRAGGGFLYAVNHT